MHLNAERTRTARPTIWILGALAASILVACSKADQPDPKASVGTIGRAVASPTASETPSSEDRQKENLAKLRDLTNALLLYCTDSDDVAPLNKNLPDEIGPYLRKADGAWTAPGDPPGKQSYSMNDKMNRVSMSAVMEPALTVLLYQGTAGAVDLSHDGKAAVSFCDGHVKTATADTVGKLKWTP